MNLLIVLLLLLFSNKSNYLTEEFTNQISSVEEDDTQLPSPAPKNVIPHKSISTEKKKKKAPQQKCMC